MAIRNRRTAYAVMAARTSAAWPSHEPHARRWQSDALRSVPQVRTTIDMTPGSAYPGPGMTGASRTGPVPDLRRDHTPDRPTTRLGARGGATTARSSPGRSDVI